MLSNMNRNPNLSETTGMGSIYTIGVSSNRNPITMESTSASHSNSIQSRGFSTISSSLVSAICTRFKKLFLPSEQSTMLDKKQNQSLSAPDIFVDISISTPIFETGHGKTTLTIPDDEDIACDIKCLSAGNSPFDWHCVETNIQHIGITKEYRFRKPNKRMKQISRDYHPSFNETPGSKERRSFHPVHSHQSKPGEKKSKARSLVLWDMKEDYRDMTDERYQEFEDMEVINYDSTDTCDEERRSLPTSQFACCPQATVLKHPMPSITDCLPECDSDDGFGIFSDHEPLYQPTFSHKMPSYAVTNLPSKGFVQNQKTRQISECSDDAIVFCYDSDYEELDCHVFGSEKGDDGEETEDESCDTDSDITASQQPDSGFEEKKVRFNLKPEVHVMRKWDFAYRKARKGEWEMAARDRERFKKRIEETEQSLKPVLEGELRCRVYNERFAS